MIKSITILSTLFALSFAQVGVANEKEQSSKSPISQNIVVKVSHGTDDLHSAVMAMKIAKLLQTKGAHTTLFFNLESVRLLDNRVPSNLSWGHTGDIGKLYDDAVKAGVKVIVCPHCAAVAGVPEKNLRAGATIGTEDSLAGMFLNADKVIDY